MLIYLVIGVIITMVVFLYDHNQYQSLQHNAIIVWVTVTVIVFLWPLVILAAIADEIITRSRRKKK